MYSSVLFSFTVYFLLNLVPDLRNVCMVAGRPRFASCTNFTVCSYPYHNVQNSIWLKKNRTSDNEVYLQQLVVASAEVVEKSQNFQKCAKCILTLVSKWNWFLTINWVIDLNSTHQKWMKFAFTVTCSIFLQSYWVSDNVLQPCMGHCTAVLRFDWKGSIIQNISDLPLKSQWKVLS